MIGGARSLEDAPGLSRGLGMSELSGDVALDPLPPDVKPKGNPALGPGPDPILPVAGFASFVGSVSEGDGAEPFRLGLGCTSPSLGDESFEGRRGVKE